MVGDAGEPEVRAIPDASGGARYRKCLAISAIAAEVIGLLGLLVIASLGSAPTTYPGIWHPGDTDPIRIEQPRPAYSLTNSNSVVTFSANTAVGSGGTSGVISCGGSAVMTTTSSTGTWCVYPAGGGGRN